MLKHGSGTGTGRVSRRGLAEAWPDHTVDRNNSTLLEGQLGDSVRELKESDGGEITTSGSSTFVRPSWT